MSLNKIESPKKMFLIKYYECSVSVAKSSRTELTKTDLGITDVPGYTMLMFREFYCGEARIAVMGITPNGDMATGNAGVAMGIYNDNSSALSGTAFLEIVWVKNEYVAEYL